MRYTEQADPRVRDIPGGELWLGTVADPHPHVVLATRAQAMAHELKRLALTISAPHN